MLAIVGYCTLSVLSTFHIGNSIMSDGSGGYVGGVSALEAIADFYEQDYTLSFHFDGGQALNSIWDNPTGLNGVDQYRQPFGYYSEALTSFEWDAVLLEPYLTNGSTLGSDKSAIDNFVNLTRQNPLNSRTEFYIYQAWPSQSSYLAHLGGKYHEFWGLENNEQNFPGDLRPTRAMRSYYRDLMQDLAVEQPDTTFRMIPTGEVFNRLSLLDLPGDREIEDFYRDLIHMNKDLGRYVTSATVYATLFKQDIRDLVPSATFHNPGILTAELRDVINQVIFEVVATNAADFNFDGIVNSMDRNVWQSGFEAGRLNGNDFLNWQRAVQQSSTTLVQIPEPQAVMLLLIALGSSVIRHRSTNCLYDILR